MNHRQSYFLFLLPLVVTLMYVMFAVYYPENYIWATYEDLYGEWGQTYFFLTTFIFSAFIVRNAGDFRGFFLLLAIVALYVFLEEISWGQRIFGFSSPEFFQDNNYQNETNIHNLFTGPIVVWTKTVLEYSISLALVGYGVLYPIALHFAFKPALWLQQGHIAPPPLALFPAFLLAAVFEVEPFDFNEAEVAELLVAMAMAFTAYLYWRETWVAQHRWAARNGLYLMLLLVCLSAYITTQYFLQQPEKQRQIERRLAYGYEKFAKRYDRHEYPQGVIAVLQLYDQYKPNNTVILRRIADNYQLLGEQQQARHYTQRAIDEGLKRYAQNPLKVTTLVSLAKSYRQAHAFARVEFYAEKAYALAKQQGKRAPKDAYWAYWLAKACEQVGEQQQALFYYRKAYKLKPRSDRYRKAYYKKKRIMEIYNAQ